MTLTYMTRCANYQRTHLPTRILTSAPTCCRQDDNRKALNIAAMAMEIKKMDSSVPNCPVSAFVTVHIAAVAGSDPYLGALRSPKG